MQHAHDECALASVYSTIQSVIVGSHFVRSHPLCVLHSTDSSSTSVTGMTGVTRTVLVTVFNCALPSNTTSRVRHHKNQIATCSPTNPFSPSGERFFIVQNLMIGMTGDGVV